MVDVMQLLISPNRYENMVMHFVMNLSESRISIPNVDAYQRACPSFSTCSLGQTGLADLIRSSTSLGSQRTKLMQVWFQRKPCWTRMLQLPNPDLKPDLKRRQTHQKPWKNTCFFVKPRYPPVSSNLTWLEYPLRNGGNSSQPLFDCQRLSHDFRPKNPCQLRRSELRFKTTRMMGLQPKFWIVSNPSTSGSGYNML